MTENQNQNQNNHHNNHGKRPERNSSGSRSSNILPPARVLEYYENIEPGSVSKLMDLAKKEQDHRHSWQDRYLKFHNFSFKSGIVCGFIYNIALLALVYKLVQDGKTGLALKLFIVNAVLVAFAIIVTTVERKITTRKPPRRNAGGQGKNRQNQPKRPQAPRQNT